MASVAVAALREERILDGAAQGKTFDALRRPVGRNVLATHAPNFFGVTFEERVEEAFAELITHPILEVARIAYWKKPRLQPGENAQCRSYDAELDQRFERLERIGKEFAAVKNPRGTWSNEHVIRQDLCP